VSGKIGLACSSLETIAPGYFRLYLQIVTISKLTYADFGLSRSLRLRLDRFLPLYYCAQFQTEVQHRPGIPIAPVPVGRGKGQFWWNYKQLLRRGRQWGASLAAAQFIYSSHANIQIPCQSLGGMTIEINTLDLTQLRPQSVSQLG
jgi:hypothetical protein